MVLQWRLDLDEAPDEAKAEGEVRRQLPFHLFTHMPFHLFNDIVLSCESGSAPGKA